MQGQATLSLLEAGVPGGNVSHLGTTQANRRPTVPLPHSLTHTKTSPRIKGKGGKKESMKEGVEEEGKERLERKERKTDSL